MFLFLSTGSVCRAERVGSARGGDEAVEQSVDRQVDRRGQRKAQLRVERHRALSALLCDLTSGHRAARQLLTKTVGNILNYLLYSMRKKLEVSVKR